jgi:hypothetical protein
MSTLQLIAKATISLPDWEQRSLLRFLESIVAKRSSTSASASNAATMDSPQPSLGLHPDLLPFIGVLPGEIDTNGLHDHRLLKHA